MYSVASLKLTNKCYVMLVGYNRLSTQFDMTTNIIAQFSSDMRNYPPCMHVLARFGYNLNLYTNLCFDARQRFWATVCKTVRPMLSNRCLSCVSVLSVCNVDLYCSQMVAWIKMALGTKVGFGPGHTVLDGDPAPSHGMGHSSLPTFAVYRRRQACVRIKRGLCLLWPNGWMDQDTTWYAGSPLPRRHYVRWGPSSPRKGHSSPPTFLPMSIHRVKWRHISVVAMRSPFCRSTRRTVCSFAALFE